MPCPRIFPVSAVSALLFALAAQAAHQSRSVSGVVHTAKDVPVVRTQVSIDSAGSAVTTDSGTFAIPLVPPLKVGFAATFHVAGWVIFDPFVLARGRTYLPDPDAEPIAIKVLRRGDWQLLSQKSIARIVEQKVSRFEPKPVSAAAEPRASSSGGSSPAFPGRDKPVIPGWGETQHSSYGYPMLVAAAHHSNPPLGLLDPRMEEPPPEREGVADEYLETQAVELGFTATELSAAIGKWAKSVEDPYQKGLAALYYGQYTEASRLISESLASSMEKIPEHYVPLARAEYEQGDYPAAEAALRKVLAIHRDDALLLDNLAVVLDAQARSANEEQSRSHGLASSEDLKERENQSEDAKLTITNETGETVTIQVVGISPTPYTVPPAKSLTITLPLGSRTILVISSCAKVAHTVLFSKTAPFSSMIILPRGDASAHGVVVSCPPNP